MIKIDKNDVEICCDEKDIPPDIQILAETEMLLRAVREVLYHEENMDEAEQNMYLLELVRASSMDSDELKAEEERIKKELEQEEQDDGRPVRD